MELDSRILEGKKPLDCFDVKKAKQFIGKKGLFGRNILQFMNLDTCPKCVVDELKKVNNYTGQYTYVTSDNHAYMYFLPAEWLKESEEWLKEPENEKKYRAFSLNEFSELYAIGDVVTFRLKDCEVIEQSMLIGFQSSHDEDIPGNGYVLIGNCRYGFMELFNNYELKYLNHWQPFGIEVEEK